MADREKHDEPVLHSEVLALKERVDALEARVTELEKELRETQESAPLD
jgi:polyhydroxyalkanoate synthesis regulator phasin